MIFEVGWAFYHLTEIEGLTWRDADYKVRSIVRGMKGEPFNGHAWLRVDGKRVRFTTENIHEYFPPLMKQMAPVVLTVMRRPMSIVPVPNSNMAVGSRGPFRIIRLAQLLADAIGTGAKVEGILRWAIPRQPAHKTTGPRTPEQFQPHLRLIGDPTHDVLLFDDVFTSGSQIIAAARILEAAGHPPRFAMTVARATKEQITPVSKWRRATLDTQPTLPFSRRLGS